MSAALNNISLDLHKLSGLLRKCGFERWRHCFCGSHAYTGEKVFFLVELFLINPGLSPSVIQCSKPEPLVGSLDTSELLMTFEPPASHSYVLVRVAAYGSTPRVFTAIYPCKDFIATKKEIQIKDGAFFLDGKTLKGSFIDQYCISWKLNVSRQSSFSTRSPDKGMFWNSSGTRAVFSGEISIQNESYIVSPGASYGYIDKMWGKKLPCPFFHLSCSHMRSSITGMVLANSSFAIQGMYSDSFSVFSEIATGDQVVRISQKKASGKPFFDCVASEDTLHWIVSSTYKGYLLDIDVFCKTSDMFVRTYPLPSDSMSELQVLGGTAGTGELRLYNRIGKNIEQIEQVQLEDVICEYGGLENLASQ
ncbi:MAG: hypothetical protein J6B32_08180 [Spirochaetaceae bacterium]|nr:hypothetical protein [Spirochaetaceae bacterium]